jgi:hypothetical protein
MQMMTLAEANTQATQLLAMMRVVMPRASDREIFSTVAGDIRPPRNAPERVVADYDLLRRTFDDITGG